MGRIWQHGGLVDVLKDGQIVIVPHPGKKATVTGDLDITGSLTQNGAPVDGGGSVTLETPVGVVNGSNTDFLFVGVPFDVRRNGVSYAPSEFSVIGTTATIIPAPPSGVITGLTQ